MRNPMSEKFHCYGYKALPLFLRTPLQIGGMKSRTKDRIPSWFLWTKIRASQESQPSNKVLTESKSKRLGENSTQTSQALFQNAISQSTKMLCKQKSEVPSTPHLLMNRTAGVCELAPLSRTLSNHFMLQHDFKPAVLPHLLCDTNPIRPSFSIAAAFQTLQPYKASYKRKAKSKSLLPFKCRQMVYRSKPNHRLNFLYIPHWLTGYTVKIALNYH